MPARSSNSRCAHQSFTFNLDGHADLALYEDTTNNKVYVYDKSSDKRTVETDLAFTLSVSMPWDSATPGGVRGQLSALKNHQIPDWDIGRTVYWTQLSNSVAGIQTVSAAFAEMSSFAHTSQVITQSMICNR